MGMEILYVYITLHIYILSVYVYIYIHGITHKFTNMFVFLVCFKIRKRQLAKFPRINPHPFIVGPGGASMALWSIIRVAVGFTRWDTP